jgi:hypothetical protein
MESHVCGRKRTVVDGEVKPIIVEKFEGNVLRCKELKQQFLKASNDNERKEITKQMKELHEVIDKQKEDIIHKFGAHYFATCKYRYISQGRI